MGKHRKRRRRRRSKMSQELEAAFQELGLDVGPGKTAINGKKWSVNEPGETESISKALNPPSIGAKPGAVAKSGKARNWGFLIKAAIAALVVIGILGVLYKYSTSLNNQSITAFFENAKTNLSSNWERAREWAGTKWASLKSSLSKKSGDGDASFGSDSDVDLSVEEKKQMDELLTATLAVAGALEDVTKCGTNVYALDGVRAGVLHGLVRAAVRRDEIGGVGAWPLQVAACKSFLACLTRDLLKRGYDPAAEEKAPTPEGARQLVIEWLDSLKEECPRTCELRRVLGELTDPRSAFAGSAKKDESRNVRVGEIYRLLDDVSAPVSNAPAAAFGADPKKANKAGSKKGDSPETCSFVGDVVVDGSIKFGRCKNPCGAARRRESRGSACVCAEHEARLREMNPDGDDAPIVLLLGHLTRTIADHPGTSKIDAALKELEGAAAWTNEDSRAEIAAKILARRGPEFGSAFIRGAGNALYNVGAETVNIAGTVVKGGANLASNVVTGTVNLASRAAGYGPSQSQTEASEPSEPAGGGLPSEEASEPITTPGTSTSDGTVSPAKPANLSEGGSKADWKAYWKSTRSESRRKAKDAKNPQRIREDGTRQQQWQEARKEERKNNQKERLDDGRAQKTATRVAGRPYASDTEFLEAAEYVVLNQRAYASLRERFEERKRNRDKLLAEFTKSNVSEEGKKEKEEPFIVALRAHLSTVPLDEAGRDESAKLARRLAERLVVNRARATKDTGTSKTMSELAEFQSAERRVSRASYSGAVVPIPFSTALEQHVASAKVMSEYVPDERQEEFTQRVDDVTIALHDRRVVPKGVDPTSVETAITKARRELYTLVKTCVISEAPSAAAAAFGKRGKRKADATVRGAWQSLMTSRKFAFFRSETPIVYGTCVPGDEDMDPETALAAFRRFIQEERKESVVDTLVKPSDPPPAFGMDTDLGAWVKKGADAIGAGKIYDAGATVINEGLDWLTLFGAVAAAARVGESVIMELMKFLLDGALLLKDLLEGTETKITSEAILRKLVSTKEQEDAEAEVDSFVKARGEGREDAAKILKLDAELQRLKDEEDKLSKSKFGGGAAKPPDDPEKKKATPVTESSDAAVAPALAETMQGKSRLGERAQAMSVHAKEAIKTFLNQAGSLIMSFIIAIRDVIWETFDTGNVFDLFGNVAKKIRAFVETQGQTGGDSMYDRLMGFLYKIRRLGTASRLVVYVRGLVAWCNQPSKLRGLFTDPAEVLEAAADDAKRQILRNDRFAKMARVGVMTLFVLRLLQILRRVAISSIVHTMACNTADMMVKRTGFAKELTKMLGSQVMSLASCKELADEVGNGKSKEQLETEVEDAKKRVEEAKAKAAAGKFGSSMQRGYRG